MTDPLTPGMRQALDRIRAFETQYGKLPTPKQYAHLYGMNRTSADAMFTRLAAVGVLARRVVYKWDEPAVWANGSAGPIVEYLEGKLREADAILSTIAVGDRPRRDRWRAEVAAYLGERQERVA